MVAATLSSLFLATPAAALQTIAPAYPRQNNVRWWELDWQYVEIKPLPQGAAVRLYFYSSEVETARVAASVIAEAYRDVSERFAFVPTEVIPLHLYISHFALETTTAPPLVQSTPGVTLPPTTKTAVLFWGDLPRFSQEVRRTLAAAFVTQKLEVAGAGASCNPKGRTPQWLIQGLAELAAAPGLTEDALALLAGAFFASPSSAAPPQLPAFFSEVPRTFERDHVYGRAQVLFLRERFGAALLQRLLDDAAKMCELGPSLFLRRTDSAFAAYLGELAQMQPSQIESEWLAWARARIAAPLATAQPWSSVAIVPDLGAGEIDALSLSPNGVFLLYRMYDRQVAVARLYLRHLPSGTTTKIAEDHGIGLVSLHAGSRNVTALGDDALVYIGRVGGTDHLFVQRYRWTTDGFTLGSKVEHDLAAVPGLIEAGSPALQPGTGAVSFVGLRLRDGMLEIYRLAAPFAADTAIERLTDTFYAKHDLAFVDDTLWMVTNATSNGQDILARLVAGRVEPVPELVRFGGVRAPQAAGDLGVSFECVIDGLPQACLWRAGEVVQLSAAPTGLRDPAISAADGALYGMMLIAGRSELVRVPQALWLARPAAGGAAPAEPPWTLPAAAELSASPYAPLSPSNWRLATALAAVGTGITVLGNLQVTDTFRSYFAGARGFYISDVEDAYIELFFSDLATRVGRGGRVFFASGEQYDRGRAYTLQRFGGDATVTYPFNQYIRLDGFLGAVGLRSTKFEDVAEPSRQNGTWAAFEGGASLALDTLRLAYAGPVKGTALALSVQGTVPLGDPRPYVSARLEAQQFITPVPGYHRFYLHGRAAAAIVSSSSVSEQFYLPSVLNLRVLRDNSTRVIGDAYALLQGEVNFPIAPRFSERFFLQGLIGADVGAVAFRTDNFWDQRAADVIGGVGVVLSPLIVRGFVAAPVGIGGRELPKGWTFKLTVAAPLLGYF